MTPPDEKPESADKGSYRNSFAQTILKALGNGAVGSIIVPVATVPISYLLIAQLYNWAVSKEIISALPVVAVAIGALTISIAIALCGRAAFKYFK